MLAFLKARWFPYVAIAGVAGGLVVFGWGYLKGYDSAEDKYLKEMNEALEAQKKRLIEIHQKDMANALKKQTRVSNVRSRIQDVHRPECHLTPECLRAFNDGVLATGTNPPRVDDAP